jgi:hypothetical protein
MWLIAMVPAPMLILSVIATSHRLSGIIGSPSAFNIGMIASATWIALVLVGVVCVPHFLSRLGRLGLGSGPRCDRELDCDRNSSLHRSSAVGRNCSEVRLISPTAPRTGIQ